MFSKKQFLFIKMALVISLALTTFSTAADKMQYPAAHIASPDIYNEILTNKHVRVLTMTLDPGESDLWHHHPAETVYFTAGGTLKIHVPDGGNITKQVKAGDVMWHEAWVHQVENRGTTVVKAVIVENVGDTQQE